MLAALPAGFLGPSRHEGAKGDGMSLLSGRRIRWAALGAIAGALIVGGIAWADIPDAGVIHGCFKTSGGSLRVIDSSKGARCNQSEQPLSWNQTGPTGPSGAAGPTSILQGSTQVINLSTMLTHTITADEAGLIVAVATVELQDRDPAAGGPTSVTCSIGGITGPDASGSGDVGTLFDSFDDFDRDHATLTLMRRGTVAEGDLIFIGCESFADDDDEASGFAQMLLEHVAS